MVSVLFTIQGARQCSEVLHLLQTASTAFDCRWLRIRVDIPAVDCAAVFMQAFGACSTCDQAM